MSDMLSDLYPNAMYLPVNRFNALIRTGESCPKTLLAQNPRFPCMQNHWQMCLPKSISAVPQKELFWSSPTLSLLALSCGSSPLLNRISLSPVPLHKRVRHSCYEWTVQLNAFDAWPASRGITSLSRTLSSGLFWETPLSIHPTSNNSLGPCALFVHAGGFGSGNED